MSKTFSKDDSIDVLVLSEEAQGYRILRSRNSPIFYRNGVIKRLEKFHTLLEINTSNERCYDFNYESD